MVFIFSVYFFKRKACIFYDETSKKEDFYIENKKLKVWFGLLQFCSVQSSRLKT